MSGLYSPVKLGEVISVRHFKPSGQVNPWNRSDTDRIEKLTFENGQFVRQPKTTPEPQRLLTVIDAFESIKWAMIFARWGKEPDVVRFCEFFINMVRDNPNKIPQVREYYKKTSWDLAMHQGSLPSPVRSTESSQKPPTPKIGTSRRPIALLSFFDGVAAAHQALEDIGAFVTVSRAWETDEDCLRTVAGRHQWGDVASSAPEKVASLLDQRCAEHTLIVICGAPPCHDFSNIKGAGALGTSGPEGAKFVQWADWILRFRKLLKQQSAILVENVVMAATAQETLDKCLGLRSFLCDAAWGLVSRPRLWWSDAITPPDPDAQHVATVVSGMARWRKWNRQWELLPSSPRFHGSRPPNPAMFASLAL